MAILNNINGSVNFLVAGNVQTGTAVVGRSRLFKMRTHSRKPLTQPHYLRLSTLSSRESQEQCAEADALSAAGAWSCRPASENLTAVNVTAVMPPAIWASLVISRAISL